MININFCKVNLLCGCIFAMYIYIFKQKLNSNNTLVRGAYLCIVNIATGTNSIGKIDKR